MLWNKESNRLKKKFHIKASNFDMLTVTKQSTDKKIVHSINKLHSES